MLFFRDAIRRIVQFPRYDISFAIVPVNNARYAAESGILRQRRVQYKERY